MSDIMCCIGGRYSECYTIVMIRTGHDGGQHPVFGRLAMHCKCVVRYTV